MQVVEFSKKGYEIKKIFGSKSTDVKWNYQIWRIGVLASWQKVPKLDVQNEFSMSKIIGIFLIFSLKDTNLGAHFLIMTSFDDINFWITLFSEMMSNFQQLAIIPIIIISFDYNWFSAKNLFLKNSTTGIVILSAYFAIKHKNGHM